MATRAGGVPRHQQKAGAAKPKPSDGRSRKILGDIGNVVNTREVAILGKPISLTSRPITRSFGAQLLANAQAAAVAQKKSTVVFEACKGTQKVVAPAPARKTTKQKPENVNKEKSKSHHNELPEQKAEKAMAKTSNNPVNELAEQKAEKAMAKTSNNPVDEVSSDIDEKMKSASGLSIACSARRSSNQSRKTLTSVLTARSKMACGIKEKVGNIDAMDADDQQAVVEYVEDIYKFYRVAENASRIHDYIHSQPEINSRMRSILADWLIEVHNKFELMPETMYLTMYIIDKYLSVKTVPRRELQLLGIGAMLIACKYEEIWAPEVNDFECISDRAYNREQILKMEKMVLNKLEWSLTVPTPYVFLVRFIKAAQSDKEMEHMTFFFSELALVNYCMIMFSPSVIAASCVYAAQCTLRKGSLWNETLKLHTGFSETQLTDCAKMLVQFHSVAAGDKLKAVLKKYSSPERSAVALLPPATKLMGKDEESTTK